MGFFGRARVVTVMDEHCDRCGCTGRVRVGKSVVVELKELDGEPHAVNSQELDLVFCGYDYDRNADRLKAGAWRVLDDRR